MVTSLTSCSSTPAAKGHTSLPFSDFKPSVHRLGVCRKVTECFLAECYQPDTSPGWLEATSRAIDRAGRASNTRCLDAILVPEDQVAFFLLEAATPEAARAALASAGVRVDRISRSERSSLHRSR